MRATRVTIRPKRIPGGEILSDYLAIIHLLVFDTISSKKSLLQRLAKESSAESDSHRLDLSIVGQRILAKLSSNPRLLKAAKWHLVAEHVVVVDPDGTRLQLVSHSDGGVKVCGMNGGGKTVGGLVASLDNFILSLELADRAHGAENLLLHDLHILANARENGWLDEVALVALALTTGLDLGAGLLPALDVGHDSVELELAHLWALEGVGSKWVANDILGCSRLEGFNELVVDAGLNVDARTSAAALAVVEENAKVDPRDGIFKVCVVEDDVG